MSLPVFDAAYLESYTGGDPQIVAEVLALFQQQAQGWLAALDAPLDDLGDGWRDLAHTMKGSAKGIGAQALGEVAGAAELADASHAARLREALLDALAEIEGYLSRVGGG
jgi:HPt (histidine-containing phosphotransfer) domain-containing protein